MTLHCARWNCSNRTQGPDWTLGKLVGVSASETQPADALCDVNVFIPVFDSSQSDAIISIASPEVREHQQEQLPSSLAVFPLFASSVPTEAAQSTG